MTRTKWMRLAVSDLADILRWAGSQDIRQLDTFRHRTIHGREFVSFRMVPRYAIEIGTSDILVVAHVRAGARQRLAASLGHWRRRAIGRCHDMLAALKPSAAAPAPIGSAELYQFAALRRTARP